jgi:hypothetical protein
MELKLNSGLRLGSRRRQFQDLILESTELETETPASNWLSRGMNRRQQR